MTCALSLGSRTRLDTSDDEQLILMKKTPILSPAPGTRKSTPHSVSENAATTFHTLQSISLTTKSHKLPALIPYFVYLIDRLEAGSRKDGARFSS